MSLKKRELKILEQKLHEERAKILAHLQKIEDNASQDMSELTGDSADIASLEIAQESLSKLGNREMKVLKLIDHAIKKLADGSYGICEYSGEDIPFARLEVSPWAKYTVEAKEELERKERHYRKGGEASTPDFGSDGD
ncbi:MAG: TraR/DksA family transcriptional regulator [Deltaproteobacteria bacterium]|nr:TraR/DksA family transcriptional regulator [Deltaproteobacteria bacterium]